MNQNKIEVLVSSLRNPENKQIIRNIFRMLSNKDIREDFINELNVVIKKGNDDPLLITLYEMSSVINENYNDG